MADKLSGMNFPFGKEELMPQEEMLEVARSKVKLVIGIPKEHSKFESRVGLTPEAVELLVNNGHEVIIEKDAGQGANYTDNIYSEHGGFIVDNAAEIFKCDIVLKIAPLNLDEINLLKGNQVIFSSLPYSEQSEEYIRKMMQKKVTAISYEELKDKLNYYPVIRSMSEIAGTTSILIASEYLSNQHDGKGVLLGGVSGITVMIVL